MSISKPVLRAYISKEKFKKFKCIARFKNMSVSKLIVMLCEDFIKIHEELYGEIEVDDEQ